VVSLRNLCLWVLQVLEELVDHIIFDGRLRWKEDFEIEIAFWIDLSCLRIQKNCLRRSSIDDRTNPAMPSTTSERLAVKRSLRDMQI